MPETTIDNQTASAVAIAVVPNLGPIPMDSKGAAEWGIRHSAAVEAVIGNIIKASDFVEQAEIDRQYFAEFFGNEKDAPKTIRFGRIVGVTQEKGQAWVCVDNGWGVLETTFEQKMKMWEQNKIKTRKMYQRDGELREDYGLELYRSPHFTDEEGRGLQVKRVAEMNVGKNVRIYRRLQNWTTEDKRSIKLKIADKIEPVQGEIDLREANEHPVDDDEDRSGYAPGEPPPEPPARRSRVRSDADSRARRNEPEPEPVPEDEAELQPRSRRASRSAPAQPEEEHKFQRISQLVRAWRTEANLSQDVAFAEVEDALIELGYADEHNNVNRNQITPKILSMAYKQLAS